MTRRVVGLKWVREVERPAGIPLGRPRGAKAQGLRYQRAVEAFLPDARCGLWFEFEDYFGRGVCQIDLILRRGEDLVLLEAKNSWTLEGHLQMEDLYLPLLRRLASPRGVLGVLVTKNLRLAMPQDLQIAATLEEAIEWARVGKRSVWHWRPQAAMVALAA